MAVAKKCDRCGKFYEATDARVFKTEDGFKINSIRIGDWDQRSRSWISIGSAYDLCDDCGKVIYEAICGDESSIKVHSVERTKNFPTKNRAVVGARSSKDVQINELEAEQLKFAVDAACGGEE